MNPERRTRDLALVRACASGSNEAWAELVATHRVNVRFAVIRTLRSHGCAADDALVDDLEGALFLRLAVDDFRRLRLYRGQATLKSWLKVMAANATVDHLRRRRPTVPIGPGEPFDIAPDEPSQEDVAQRRQFVARLRSLWQQLPEADAEFVEMYFVRELGFDEIAARTGTTPGALYARKNRIRHKLIALAERDGWFDGADGRREETG